MTSPVSSCSRASQVSSEQPAEFEPLARLLMQGVQARIRGMDRPREERLKQAISGILRYYSTITTISYPIEQGNSEQLDQTAVEIAIRAVSTIGVVNLREMREELLVLADVMWTAKDPTEGFTPMVLKAFKFKEIAKCLLGTIDIYADKDGDHSTLTSKKTSEWLTNLVTHGVLHPELLQEARDLNLVKR